MDGPAGSRLQPRRFSLCLAAAGRGAVARHGRQRRHVVLCGGAARGAGRFRARPAPTPACPTRWRWSGFAVGNMILGRLADRFGIVTPILLSIASLGIGYVSAGFAPTLWLLSAAHLLIGFGSAASFGPLIADLSHWFQKRRGIAIAIAASGNYVAGAVWPPIIQHFIASDGWRATHIGTGIFCVIAMLPLSLMFRGRPDVHADGGAQVRGLRRAGYRRIAQYAVRAALHRRRRLLRRDGDAAGPYRRLLRRPRLRRCARRGNAVADAGVRHHQPCRAPDSSPIVSAASSPC